MKAIYILIILFYNFYSYSQNLEENLFNEANNYYLQQEYPSAIEIYQQILDSNIVSFELYFNLANAYFQYGKIAQSIYYYEKALIEKPHQKQCLNNLNLAKNRIENISPIPTLFYLKWWNSLSSFFSINFWIILVIISVWISTALIIIFIKHRKKWIFNTTLFSLSILLISSSLLYNSNRLNKQLFGIIMNSTQLYKNINSTASFYTVKAGNKVLIKEEHSNKLLILLQDGQSGWIENNSIKKLNSIN